LQGVLTQYEELQSIWKGQKDVQQMSVMLKVYLNQILNGVSPNLSEKLEPEWQNLFAQVLKIKQKYK
jgi:hypothetical protein